MKYFTYIVFLFICIFSCQNEKSIQAEKILKEWIDKEILFPESLKFSIQGSERVPNFAIHDSEYKIVAYVDSMGCTSCKLHLSEWNNYITNIDSIYPNKVQFLFFFFPKNGRDIYFTLRMERFMYPICIDTLDVLNRINHFPSDMQYQTFLLDKNNKVVAIGNPVQNPRIKELYRTIISGKQYSSFLDNQPLTTVSLSSSQIEMGSFSWEKEQEVEFEICNTGKTPLVINDVITSCGCTTVEYSKEPVQPDMNLNLKIRYHAEHPEHFSKTISVYCNAEGSPFHLKISGNAK
ncbi:DUF1573 domain-containing protein [Bacteroides sp. AN502(2024)]|uniref:DUF1573 domain-containing protein n=1 Tax=Bacteroides sp. AN502(2024) TaxID=3160599 RepID=UPI0035137816